MEDILEGIKEELSLDAEKLFETVDEYKLGYVSTNILCKWVSQHCAYKIHDDEIALILNRYDKDNDYRISKEEFLKEIVPV